MDDREAEDREHMGRLGDGLEGSRQGAGHFFPAFFPSLAGACIVDFGVDRVHANSYARISQISWPCIGIVAKKMSQKKSLALSPGTVARRERR